MWVRSNSPGWAFEESLASHPWSDCARNKNRGRIFRNLHFVRRSWHFLSSLEGGHCVLWARIRPQDTPRRQLLVNNTASTDPTRFALAQARVDLAKTPSVSTYNRRLCSCIQPVTWL